MGIVYRIIVRISPKFSVERISAFYKDSVLSPYAVSCFYGIMSKCMHSLQEYAKFLALVDLQ